MKHGHAWLLSMKSCSCSSYPSFYNFSPLCSSLLTTILTVSKSNFLISIVVCTHIFIFVWSFSSSALILSCLYAFSMHALGYITPFWWLLCPESFSSVLAWWATIILGLWSLRACGCVCDMIEPCLSKLGTSFTTLNYDNVRFFFILPDIYMMVTFPTFKIWHGVRYNITLFMKINDCYHLCFPVTCTAHQNKVPHNWITNWYTSFIFFPHFSDIASNQSQM